MSAPRATGRRRKANALSRDAVLQAAIGILDESCESGLTFRVLADRLHTGAGAIYWHVAGRSDLLDLACDAVLADPAAVPPPPDLDEIDAIRAIALALFDVLDRHPWVGAHLPSSPGLPSTLRVLDRIGGLLRSSGVPTERQFYTATAILTYVLGVAAQITRNAQAMAPDRPRDEWLAEQSKRWAQLDPAEYPFLRRVMADVRDHDDREQFTVGLDLLLAGVRAGSRR